MSLVIVHDVLGTLFDLSEPTKELQSIFSAQLQSHPDNYAELVVLDWYHATQRDFTSLSINGAYQPIGAVFKGTLPRILLQAGLAPSSDAGQPGVGGAGIKVPSAENPHGKINPYGDEVVKRMMSSLSRLAPRKGLKEAFEIYRKDAPAKVSSVDVWGATSEYSGYCAALHVFHSLTFRFSVYILDGGKEMTRGLFTAALGNEAGGDLVSASDSSNNSRGSGVGVFSCDEIKVAKPAPEVYQSILKRIGADKDTNKWFVASHTWVSWTD